MISPFASISFYIMKGVDYMKTMYDVEIIYVNNNTHVTYIAKNLDEAEANMIAEEWNEHRHKLAYHAQIIPVNN